MADDDRRRTLLDAADRLFRLHGHARTTIADIAREAGVAVGSVYLEFASKESIVEELSTGTHARVLEGMRRAARDHAPEAFEACFVAVLETRVERLLALRSQGQHACELVFCKATGVQSAHARWKAEEQTFFRGLLEDARDAGALRDIEPRVTAALLQRALVSLSPPLLFELTPEEARRTTRQMAELLLRGLVRHGSSGKAVRSATR